MSPPVTVLTLKSKEYPKLLKHISDPPARLYCRGNISLLNTECFSVVGTRSMTPYGREAARSIVPGLARHFTIVSGMALGVDQLFAEICISSGIPLIAAVPFIGQESAWPAPSQGIYKRILSGAAQTIVVCEGGYAAFKLQRRNEWMVDHCDKLLAVWDGASGGTGNCVAYAEKVGKPIERINPKNIH